MTVTKEKIVKNGIISLSIFAVVIAISIAFLFAQDNQASPTQSVDEELNTRYTQISIDIPEYSEEIYLCTKPMQRYYKGEITLQEAVESNKGAYAPFEFEYKIENADFAKLMISEAYDFSTCEEYTLSLDSKSIYIDNLKTNTDYYYHITAEDDNGNINIKKGSFKTADTNRFIYFPGVYNTRDIGGYETSYGKRVKQGMLIRGTEIDGLVENTYFLSDIEATKPFEFKCDFDLRDSGVFNANYVSRLGESVEHRFFNSPMYGGIFTVGNELRLREIFRDLADSSNYPMYFHCTYGADRTGTIVFLLQGLLGVSEEDMISEYELTGFFSRSFAYGDRINPLISGLQGVNGSTINEKIENYLIDTVGVTNEQIENIRNIFLEE